MGQGASSKDRPKEPNVLIAGAYGAGKTTLMTKLKSEKSVEPVVPSASDRSRYHNLVFTRWDMGGRCIMRPLYRLTFLKLDAVIFVVDSQVSENFFWAMAKDQLNYVLRDEELPPHLPVLILANKQDLPGALTGTELREQLELNDVQRDNLEILPVSLVTGEGMPEVLDWLDQRQKEKEFREVVVQPVKKAVPRAVASSYSKMSSALKQGFGLMKKKLKTAA